MPKAVKKKQRQEKLIHPNSRKAQQLARQQHHDNRVQKRKAESNIKVQGKVERFMWFKSQVDKLPPASVVTPTILLFLINKYLKRFDSEIEQIGILHSIRKRTPTQHLARGDTIKFTLQAENEEFDKNGFELPDILNKRILEFFRVWDGKSNFLAALKTKQFNRKTLEDMTKKSASRVKTEEIETFDISRLFEENSDVDAD